MHVERLTKLAELLDRVEAEKKPFDIGLWYDENEVDCGYVACAIGHAMVDPWFVGQGLEKNEVGEPEYMDQIGFYAVMRFFNMLSDCAMDLFTGGGYEDKNYDPAAADVAAKIRCYLADNQQQPE